MSRTALQLVRCAGLIVGPLAWVLNTQLGQVLPPLQCDIRLPLLTGISCSLALLALAAGGVSWRSGSGIATQQPDVENFIGRLSGLAGVLFAFALLLQGASSLVLSGCEQ